MNTRRVARFMALAAFLSCAAPQQAAANFHLYDITEVYSNADGSVQFIELSTTFLNQQFFAGAQLTSGQNIFTFPSNLPGPTSNTSFILATASFASLPGAVTPDYTIPENFFSPSSDTITLITAPFLPFTWSSGELPTDGLNSRSRVIGGQSVYTNGINTPTNFAGATGSIDLSVNTTVHVTFGGANGTGSEGSPFNNLADAVLAVPAGGTIRITTGSTIETILIDGTKAFGIEASGGLVTIGGSLPAQTATRHGFRSRAR